MSQYKKRYLEDQILRLSKSFPILLLTGARQVGKTTLLQHLSEKSGSKHQYVSLDEFEIRSLAKRDPGLFLKQYPSPLIIDEIQYAPELLPYIKAEVDRNKKKGSYWLTGSQQFYLMKNVSESLAGRVAILKMLGLSSAEEKEIKYQENPWNPDQKIADYNPETITEIFKRIIQGSFPAISNKPMPPLDAFYGSYVQTYIDRDLRDLVKVSSLSSFDKFIRLCAARTATMLNLSDLARDSDISVNTAKEWLSLLESAGQIYLLRPFYQNLSKRLVKVPKLYFIDTGLACYLTGWRDPVSTSRGAFAGQLFESFIFSEILKSYLHRGVEPRLYYYRTKEKVEIDILIEKNGVLMSVEIKLSSRVQESDLPGIIKLRKENKNCGQSAVIALTQQNYAISDNIKVLSPSVIL